MDRQGTGTVAVIPARGGSKRLPRKNARAIDGRPLVAWAIETCLQAEAFDRVVVSTDDDEIAEISMAAGASAPFRRPSDLSDDHTPLLPVIAHAIAALRASGDTVIDVCCVYPTALGLEPDDLRNAIALLREQDALPYVVGVVRYGHPIQRALELDDTGHLSMVEPQHMLTRTQDLPPRWHDAGQFVLGRAATWLAGTPILTNSLGYELPAWRAIDLDDEDSWQRAQVLHPIIRAHRAR